MGAAEGGVAGLGVRPRGPAQDARQHRNEAGGEGQAGPEHEGPGYGMARGGVPAWIPYCHAGLITLKIDTTSAGKIGPLIKV